MASGTGNEILQLNHVLARSPPESQDIVANREEPPALDDLIDSNALILTIDPYDSAALPTCTVHPIDVHAR